MELNFRLYFGPTIFLIAVLIVSACAPTNNPVSIETSFQASPPPAASLAAEPTQSQSHPNFTQAPVQAHLAIIKSSARVITREGIATEVQQAQSADIRVHDRIEVVPFEGQDEPGYSILHFPDFLNAELFSNTGVILAEADQEEGSSTDVTLELTEGHMFVHLNDQAMTEVTVWTPYTTINALTPGAEFDVCRNEALTCVVVKRGVVEITAQDEREIVKAGEAGFVLKDRPPSPVICAPTPTFAAWEENYRQFADSPALDTELFALPQKPCPVTAAGIPLNARILYQDDFRHSYSGWQQGEINNFMVRYVRDQGPRYYQVQVQSPEAQYLAFVPRAQQYEDVNIDIKVFTENPGGGDFRYGVVFRRSGNQYYGFAASPVTETWQFIKSSSNGLEVLKDGTDRRMRGLNGQDTLRVESYGSTFLFYINGRFMDWVRDSDFTSGEVGLFVEAIDSSDALVGFNSIIIWGIPTPVFNPDQGGENCFNAGDDDGDGWIDQADPDCHRPELISTSQPTSLPLPTNTLGPVITPTALPPATDFPAPTATMQPPPPTQPLIPTLPLPTLPPPTIPVPLPTLILSLPSVPTEESPAQSRIRIEPFR